MKRVVSGSLAHVAPASLLRLLSATAPNGVLEITSEEGELRLETVKGKVAMPDPEELRRIGRILRSTNGRFRFAPRDLRPIVGRSLTLTGLAEAAEASDEVWEAALGGDVDVERLMVGEIAELSRPAPVADIHVLPVQPLDNPLDELQADLDDSASSELLLTDVAVVSQDPRLWRGSLEAGWRRRGWELRVVSEPSGLQLDAADALILHQNGDLHRVDLEMRWLDLVRRAAESAPPVPVVWVGRTQDRGWTHRLIQSGVSFLMPAPESRAALALDRFASDLGVVLDRLMQTRQALASVRRPNTVYELVDTLLEDTDSTRAVSSLLQLASSQLSRGAVLMVEETAIRCRAGYGYPLARGLTALPRGIALLERAIRSGEAIVGVDPTSGAVGQLARVLGVERLPAETAVIPLTVGMTVAGLLVADREGASLPALDELTLVACCLGGVVVRGEHPG